MREDAAPWQRAPVPARQALAPTIDEQGRLVYPITPVPKPRPRVTRNGTYVPAKYQTFKKTVKAYGIELPEHGYHVTFELPMPKSWSKKKRAEMNGQPHQQVPDKDNLEKALLDAALDNDSRVWDGRVTKIWAETGSIIIGSC